MDVAAAMSAEEIYLKNLGEIERIVRGVARRHRLNPDDTDEFLQVVRVHLFENDYAVIRKFKGDSLLSTYLTSVIVRVYSGWRVKLWGKWRPSAEAKRMGEKAILLEQLLTRDGYSFEEAVSTLTTPAGWGFTRAELEWIHQRLPVSHRRQPPVPVDELTETESSIRADGPLEARERARLLERLKVAMEKTLDGFAAQDRLILTLRFSNGLTIREISPLVGIDQKKLFRHRDKLLAELSTRLEEAGFTRSEVLDLLAHHDQETDDDPEGGPSGGNPPSGPSHKRRGTRGGEEDPE
jgi:RNA polymerase sigma factor (sigma-70 family)